MVAKPIWGGLGAALLYYIEHKEEIDLIVEEVIGGVLRSQTTCHRTIEEHDWMEMVPAELFSKENRSSDTTQYIIDLSGKGIDIATVDEIEFISEL